MKFAVTDLHWLLRCKAGCNFHTTVKPFTGNALHQYKEMECMWEEKCVMRSFLACTVWLALLGCLSRGDKVSYVGAQRKEQMWNSYRPIPGTDWFSRYMCTLKMRTEMVLEKLISSSLNQLTWLVAREYFIIQCRRESYKSCKEQEILWNFSWKT
jgi:hypothetical protein